MSKVDDWIACDLRYVAETKLNRLTDDELARLYFGLGKKHALSITTVSADRDAMIGKLMVLKREIQTAYAKAAAAEKAQSTAEATKAVEEIFGPDTLAEEQEGNGEDGDGNVPELTAEEAAAKDREERAVGVHPARCGRIAARAARAAPSRPSRSPSRSTRRRPRPIATSSARRP